MSDLPTPETEDFVVSLRRKLSYDPITGMFHWKVRCGTKGAGKVAGNLDHTGYIHISLDRRIYVAHRLAWIYVYGKWPDLFLDHINGRKVDNRISNLREATKSQNGHNSRLRKDNSSGFKNVSFNKNHQRWQVKIKRKGKITGVSGFIAKEEAVKVATELRQKLHGEFCNHGDTLAAIDQIGKEANE